MTDPVLGRVVQALRDLPARTITGHFENRRYVATKTVFNSGKSIKFVAEQLGGADYISLNLYLLKAGPRLYPCEMSHAKVQDFVLGFQPDPEDA
ncbi:MAG: hypothetical protein AB8B47_15465 [Roseobacter sp.]